MKRRGDERCKASARQLFASNEGKVKVMVTSKKLHHNNRRGVDETRGGENQEQ